MSHDYDDRFYDWVNLTALRSARVMLPILRDAVAVDSVVDVGCGQGAWLSVWRNLGVEDVCGFDGAYVDADKLSIPRHLFHAVDLASDFGATRRFGLAQSLEVAEHLPQESAQAFVGRLCALSDIVLFSAAQPGQGGEMHINERPPSWWARLFAANGYAAYDCVRPALEGDRSSAPWYRFNTVLYANEAAAARLSEAARAARCDDLASLDDVGDLAWRLRLALLKPLPLGAVNWLSRARYRLVCALQKDARAA